MQPKFTLRELGYWGMRVFAIAMIFVLSSQLSFAQQGKEAPGSKPRTQTFYSTDKQIQAKKDKALGHRSGTVVVSATADNDAGLPNHKIANTHKVDAVCATFTGALASGDPIMTSRINRNGVGGVCPGPKPFAGTLAANTYYDTYTWTNNSGLSQCATFTLTTTDATTNIEFGVYDGSFDPNNLATNFFTDPGLSSGTPPTPTVCSANVSAGQTLVFVVFSPNALQTATDYTLTVDLPICASAPCSGTPAPGNTVSTANPVCSGINFTLSAQNATAGSGVTYQWEKSSDNVTYAPIAGATGSTYTTNQTATTWYRVKVTCSGNTGTSTPLQVTMKPPSQCYCLVGPSDCTDNDVITRVRISNLDNPSACSPNGYGDYTSSVAPANVFSGANNKLIVDVPQVWPEDVGVWIDYNQNGQFEASEFTHVGDNTASATITKAVAIPSTALSGNTRMRVRVQFATLWGSGDACITIPTGFGETEDYIVNIQPCVPVTVATSPANASIACGSNASFTVVTNGSLPDYAWEYRTSASAPWQLVADGGVFSGSTTNTLSLNNVPQTWNGYQFRALVSGGCSAVDFSAAATLTVSQIVPAVTPSSATICLGSIQKLTLNNTLGNIDLVGESFASVLPANWATQNLSNPAGTTGWFQGNSGVFPSHSGAPEGYIAANYQNTSGVGTISNWLFSPVVSIKNGDIIKFWTRTTDGTFPDRLEVRLSTNGNSVNAGATESSVGDFTNLLLTVNAPLDHTSYPTSWTQFTATVSGVTGTVSGRFAFRYYVTNGGPAGANSDYIGIDDVSYTSLGGPAQGVWTTSQAGTIYTDALASSPYVAGTPLNAVWVKPTSSATYSVQFTTPTPCTSAITTVPVTVINPTGTVTSPTNKSVCVGGTTTFTSSATGGPNAYQWQVSTDGGVTWVNVAGGTSANLTLTGVTQLMNNNRYRVLVSAPPCSGSLTSSAAILTVNPLPIVTISASDVSLTPGQTTTITATSNPAATSYAWTLNGAAITGTTNTQTAGIDQLGDYQATATDVNGCVNKSNVLTIDAEASDKLWIYPNPTSGKFQVRLYYASAVSEKRVITIYNLQGQSVMSKEFNLVQSTPAYLEMDFDLSHVGRGTYVVKVAHKYTHKVISGLVVIQ